MKTYKVCIIGAGNISNTRHIPALLKNKQVVVYGVISDDAKKIARTVEKYKFLENKLLLVKENDIKEQLESCDWFINEVDAVVIGTPPRQHYLMTKICLELNKHVMVEKPMAMNVQEAEEMSRIAKERGKVLNVMHSFQFSNGMEKLYERFQSGEFGELKSILELQLTNRDRRLPVWYNELPLGLFYDEAAHFFYSARRFGGKLEVKNASACFNKKKENTPCFLQAQLTAGEVPVQMYMNFNSPICEWGLLLICEKKIAIYDYFKDVLVVLNNDNQHMAKDVLKTSLGFTFKFWGGFIKNGLKMVSHNLLYGQDNCMNRYIKAIEEEFQCFELSPELGIEVVEAMNKIVEMAKA